MKYFFRFAKLIINSIEQTTGINTKMVFSISKSLESAKSYNNLFKPHIQTTGINLLDWDKHSKLAFDLLKLGERRFAQQLV